ncbi:hypothetical protein CcaverHIS002_0101050 [Cutaneotrichosporon cavernicola]|uniref:Nuclear pore complex protein Nup85 n=1 Tax=Cutaneotrichosporon cavernicola TaxID=279322 RepID=A0AA48I3W2_9TREE|nr:uncharacterized protein CcaverHIS019_0101030 [Cutaneotrichosporon cavernicola]BEI79576.1 hypothetical protein CcaverHIS002_0101050 [Cutaneotrichosporon cavernicola]BEI87385.1 hypothetical protein CcaverHIS019_0101030 [Cutaneotrichosporon cavernicola]BEI95154.1 hypothetical protein CcaverHIS631_0101030 [Cutaneotrichosporon cavernicola]BEJ02928.1 hypothetical protein CcaverHIS641_0101030 [Cutaneotrichosporon cavernicola]
MSAFGSGSAFSFSSPSSSTNKPFSFSNSVPKHPTPLANTFLPPSSTSASATDMVMDGFDDDETDVYEEHLDPPAFTRQDKAKWKASGRTLLAAAARVGGGVAAWVAKQPSKKADEPAILTDKELSLADNMVYISAINSFPPALEDFFSSTCTVFTNLQQIIASAIRLPAPGAGSGVWDTEGNLVALDGVLGPPAPETIVHMRKIVEMYLQDIDRIRHADDIADDTKLTFNDMYGIFNLVRILYLPADGRGQTLLGEELLDWVNQSSPAAINDDGNEIMNTQHPWNNPMFWPFLNRCVLRGFFPTVAQFLNTLSNHPHPPISKLAAIVSQYASSFPRSENFREDHAFLTEHKKWLVRFRSDVDTITGGRSRSNWLGTDSHGDLEWSGWEESFKSLVELMEGKGDRVLAEANDWREAIGAWGVLVDVWLRRDDLPGAIARVLDEIPIDSTIEDDVVLSNICLGPKGIAAALRASGNIDTWLAAHLADVFDKLDMVPDDDEFDMSTRDYLLLAYADSIMDSPSQWKLWRVIAEYLATAADEGHSRLREYILHVALPFGSAPGTDKEGTTMEVETEDDEDAVEDRDMKHFFDLQNTCMSLNLHAEWREICTILASHFMRRREYGRAASLATQARDVEILERIAESIVATYITHGAEEYLKQVNSLPASLLSDTPMLLEDEFDDEDGSGPLALYAQRLIFLAEFRDYLLFMAEGTRDRAATRLVSLIDSPTTPVAFTAVLLAESVELLEDEEIHLGPAGTFELMRTLEDTLGAARFAPHDYLHMLWQYLERTEPQNGKGKANDATKEEEKWAARPLRKLEVVRLALARNLSRAMVAGLEK